jgi:hypothetical protein
VFLVNLAGSSKGKIKFAEEGARWSVLLSSNERDFGGEGIDHVDTSGQFDFTGPEGVLLGLLS